MNRGGAHSASQHNFAHIPNNSSPRSTFNRSCGRKMTMDAGILYPCFIDEVYPGDTYQANISGSARLATPITPYMDNMYMETHWFFMPNRLAWVNWERFMGAREPDPDSPIDFLIPQVIAPAVTGFVNGSLFDNFAFPTAAPLLPVCAFPSRMYNLCWNQWYRDENLQDGVTVDTDDGPDDPADYVLLRRGKRKDYFTSCLPFTQKGAPVDIPLGTTAPVVPNGVDPVYTNGVTNAVIQTLGGGTNQIAFGAGTAAAAALRFTNTTGLRVDLTDASAATVNQLRQAFAVQHLLELDARGGTRYVELLRVHFNVISPDFRLQRVEFLGGGSSPVIVSPIAQTSETNDTPQGTLAAYATVGFNSGHGFTKSFVEHGVLMCLVSVRADLNYQQGLNRSWSRRTRYDYYFPAFANLGEQAVLNKEIFAIGGDGVQDNLVFGYQEPWAELRYKPNEVVGQFRSNFAQTLDIWHLAQFFIALPVLGDAFIQENPPIDRIKALGDDYPDFLVDLAIDLKCTRGLPLYGVPGLRKL